MTDAKRGAMLLLLGLFTAVLLYPALHEGGHILVTLLLGGRIREVRLGAAASVLCGGLRHRELAAVAFGGPTGQKNAEYEATDRYTNRDNA